MRLWKKILDIFTLVCRGNEHIMALKSHLDSKTTGKKQRKRERKIFFVKKFCYEGKSEDGK